MFEIGETVGPYQIVSQLGQGGMATVYKAYQPNLDRYIALKVMHEAFKEDTNFLTRFEREAKLVAKLEHPNIIQVYDYAEHKGNPYLVMRFVEGQTLKARMKEGPLSIARITQIVQGVGGALDYAHQLGVLHRDIKPSNIMLSKDGEVYLTDYGLARMAQAGESTMSRDMMMGTPQYISPEQAKGDHELDGGTDIYSFGVVIYEMIVGRVPYSADTPYAIIHDHIFTPLPMPTVVNPQVPELVENFLLKALAKERKDRFPTASDMVRAFLLAIDEAGEDKVEAATYVEPRSVAEVRELTGARETATRAPVISPSADAVTNVEGSSAVRRQRARTQQQRNTLWVTMGLILLVITLFASGVAFQEAVAEEFDRVFNQAVPEGSWVETLHI